MQTFFYEYRTTFNLLQADLFQQTHDEQWAHDYALQLLNRCLFLSFVPYQRWLGIKATILQILWQAYHQHKDQQTHDIFVTTWLNACFSPTPPHTDYLIFQSCPPYIHEILSYTSHLSSGLFSQNDMDTSKKFIMSDQRFTDIFMLFEHYTFTLTEHSSKDQEAVIGPEIFGIISEHLGDITRMHVKSHKAGIFYTPRIEIDLMCRLTLIDYLTNHLGQEQKHLLSAVILAREPAEQETADQRLQNAHLWHEVYHLLTTLTMLDPACGSGAFLLGMLAVLDHLIERAMRAVGLSHLDNQYHAYERKKRIIEHSLYGVDAMAWAVQSTKIQLLLTLLSELENTCVYIFHSINPPQPNLTYRVYCADSLTQTINGLKFGDPREQMHPHTCGFDVHTGSHSLSFWEMALAEIITQRQGFDIVLGNPPYVRHEQIHPPYAQPYQQTAIKAYKEQLDQLLYTLFPHFFGMLEVAGQQTVARPLNQKSDLSIYFIFLGLALLNKQGSFCFLTSNAWLDAGYGADLQAFLLKHCHIKLILDNERKRSFASARVNTVIVHCSSPHLETAWGFQHTARFVMSCVPFEHFLTPEIYANIEAAQTRQTHASYRVLPLSQDALFQVGQGLQPTAQRQTRPDTSNLQVGEVLSPKSRYIGNTWNGKYLRAPHIYWTLLEKGQGILVRLGDVAHIKRGISTGANEFFYLDEAKLRRWEIEPEFLVPIVKSPRECRNLCIDPRDLTTTLFLCHQNRAALQGTQALAYITWGEAQGFHTRPSCAYRTRWWDIGERPRSKLSLNYLIDTTAKAFYAPHGCYFSDNFQNVLISTHDVLPLWASLNSTVFQLLVNVTGRSNFGAGLLKVQTYEASNLLCVHPQALPHLTQADFLATSAWNVLEPSPERKLLDTMIFDALRLTQGERDAVYEGVAQLIHARLEKAKSIHE